MKNIILVFFLLFTCLSTAQTNIYENRLKSAKVRARIKLLNNQAETYLQTQPNKSIEYAERALKLNKKNPVNKAIEGNLYNTLGAAYYFNKNYRKSVKYYKKELEIIEKTGLDLVIMNSYYNIAAIYKILRNKKAENYYLKSLALANKNKSNDVIIKIYGELAKLMYNQRHYKKSANYYTKYFFAANRETKQKNEILASQYKEALRQKENQLNNAEEKKQELIKDIMRKSLKISTLGDLNDIQKIDIEQKNTIIRQGKIIIIVSISITLLTLIFLGVIYWLYRRIKRINSILTQKNEEISKHIIEIVCKNKEITEKSEEINVQNELLTKQKKDITDSIVYASLIQKAILPSTEILSKHFVEHFILYLPCKIVSGDFYWLKQIKNFLFVVAADCTGHGVPGAFMSMLGISLLNDIVNRSNVDHPHETLNELRKRLKKALHQTGKSGERQDGMDIAFCMIDLEENIVEFSGAYNPFYLIRDNQLMEFKANRMPIGVYPLDDQDFATTIINLQVDDKFYIFSDGYASQFGGLRGKKFKSKQFQEILIENTNKTMSVQKQILEETFDGWRGNLEQVDDILVIGINICKTQIYSSKPELNISNVKKRPVVQNY